jgi:hypothetical protein
MVPAAIAVLATRSCCVSTGVPNTGLCMYPQRKKSNGVNEGERGYWASTSNPSVAKGFIKILTDDISAVCRGAIMLEPHFTRDFHYQQLE